MTAVILPVLGWLCVLALTAVVVSSAHRVIRGYLRKPAVHHGWTTPGLFGIFDLSALTGLGIIPLANGAILAAVLFAGYWTMLIFGRKRYGRPLSVFRADLISGWSWTKRDVARLARGARARRAAGAADGQNPDPPVVTQPFPVRPRPQAPQRPVPAFRPAPAPDPGPSAPDPRDIAAGIRDSGIPVPPAWQALAERIAGFEPENAEMLLAHIDEEAAGVIAYAEALKQLADYLASPGGTRLDPGFVQGYHELADEVADMTASFGSLGARFHAIYESVLQWLAEAPGRQLPKDGDFLGDGGATETGDGGLAA